MTVKPLWLREKIGLRKITIHNTNPVIGIQGAYQVMTGFPDRLHMPGSDIPCGANECKILHPSIKLDLQIYHLSADSFTKERIYHTYPIITRTFSDPEKPLRHQYPGLT